MSERNSVLKNISVDRDGDGAITSETKIMRIEWRNDTFENNEDQVCV